MSLNKDHKSNLNLKKCTHIVYLNQAHQTKILINAHTSHLISKTVFGVMQPYLRFQLAYSSRQRNKSLSDCANVQAELPPCCKNKAFAELNWIPLVIVCRIRDMHDGLNDVYLKTAAYNEAYYLMCNFISNQNAFRCGSWRT